MIPGLPHARQALFHWVTTPSLFSRFFEIRCHTGLDGSQTTGIRVSPRHAPSSCSVANIWCIYSASTKIRRKCIISLDHEWLRRSGTKTTDAERRKDPPRSVSGFTSGRRRPTVPAPEVGRREAFWEELTRCFGCYQGNRRRGGKAENSPLTGGFSLSSFLPPFSKYKLRILKWHNSGFLM